MNSFGFLFFTIGSKFMIFRQRERIGIIEIFSAFLRNLKNRRVLYIDYDGIVLLANLHVAAAVSNAPFIEFPYDPPYWTLECRDYMLPEPIRSDQSGKVCLSDAPGLGVTIDWKAIEAFRV